MNNEFPGAPRMLTPAEQAEVMTKLRAAHVEFEARGGRRCHCGGLIYPGERYTCTHDPVAHLTSAEIGAYREAWERDRASTERRALVQGDYSARGICSLRRRRSSRNCRLFSGTSVAGPCSSRRRSSPALRCPTGLPRHGGLTPGASSTVPMCGRQSLRGASA